MSAPHCLAFCTPVTLPSSGCFNLTSSFCPLRQCSWLTYPPLRPQLHSGTASSLRPVLSLESHPPHSNFASEKEPDLRYAQHEATVEEDSNSSNSAIEDDRQLSHPNLNTFNPNTVKRSKMLLTRRIFAWTLRRRILRSQTKPRSVSEEPGDFSSKAVASGPSPVATLLGQQIPVDQLPLEELLSPNEPVSTFVFHRGHTPYSLKKRHGDPPSRFLKLSYSLVDPLSPHCTHCSNPRASGNLKQWYQVASRWNVLGNDFRQPLLLTESRRVTIEHGRLRRSRTRVTTHSRQKASGHNLPFDNVSKTDDSRLSPLLRHTRWDRALGRSPRVIAIGDVHGCIEELQALLRLADYQPGDQVVLLGDMVAKGPDSVAVIQLAREIGARGVRGNHDFEVVRWWEAYCRGDSEVVVSIEHARIAQSLGEKEHTWLMECPWFIECSEMSHLFVHAGFIPGVKLTQQNPRLMMNMRSVLFDGTVTAKNVDDCEWAKLWRGPQTVVFGHDAYRGLQLHDFAKGIDTGCVYGGRLTALLLPENRLISVPSKRAYIERKRFRTAPLFN